MKKSIYLYIADRMVDLSDEAFILMNYLREDLSNPTIVQNSFSQSITLEGTRRNNRIFGEIFHLDRKTLLSTTYFDGAYFDPKRKTPFAIHSSTGEVVESGYCKLESVNINGDVVTYTISLYGGLGSFLYSLSSSESGEKLTLADLRYKDYNGVDITNFGIRCYARDVEDAWDYLKTGEGHDYRFWNIINFLPAYNGLPADFDTKHALVNHHGFDNVPLVVTKDGKTYGYKDGTDCCLAKFTNSHTEWEMCDLRWYLQRPAVSVRGFIEAICDPRNNGGYEVSLDSSFFVEDNHLYWDGWITLPMIATEDRGNEDCLVHCLASSKTPAEYLVSFAKMFGLVFMCDTSRKVITILTRASFYSQYSQEMPHDLTDRIDQDSIEVIPTLTDTMWYQFGDKVGGEFAEFYEDNYGSPYASQKVNTGYEFNADVKVVTDGIVFKDMVEVQESSILFTSQALQPDGQGGWQEQLILPRYEDVSVELWNTDEEVTSVLLECSVSSRYPDNPDMEFMDWLPKLQLHSEDNKSIDGADVLVVFEGFADAPVYASMPRLTGKSYYLTEDNDAMDTLLGKPCYDLTMTGTAYTSLPSFRRHHISGNIIVETYEWGEPSVRPVLGLIHPQGDPTTIYARYWRDYLTDRFNTDTKVMTAKVDLTGLQVGQELLRHFFYYDNTLWVLNRIVNHSLTTYDLTECEFVKVGNTDAYTTGTHTIETRYLNITPSSQSASMIAEGGSARFGIASSSAWTLTGSATGMTPSRTSGSSGITWVEVAVTPNGQSSVRKGTFTITNDEGLSKTISIIQAGASIVDSRTISFNATSASVTKAAQTFSVRVTCSGSILASELTPSSDVSWVTGLTVSQVSDTVLEISGSIQANTEAERVARIGAQIKGTNIYTPTTYDITQAQGLVSSFYYSPTGYQLVGSNSQMITIEIGATRSWSIGFSTQITGSSLTPTSGGAGVNFVTLYIPANTGTSSRNTTVEIVHGTTRRYIEFEQAGRGTETDTITVNPSSVNIGAASGSTVTSSVTASASWSVSTNGTSSWLTASATSYAKGTRTLTITASSANYSQAARVGKVTLVCGSATAVIQVTQANAYITASPSSPSLSAAGDPVSVSVSSSDAWGVISASPSWLNAVKDGSTVIVSASANTTGAQRTGTVILALNNDSSCRATLSVTQITGGSQKEDSINVGQTSMLFNPGGEEKPVTVYATGAWTLSQLPSWLTADKVSGTGSEGGEEVILTAEPNADDEDRTATIRFSLTGSTLHADISVSQTLQARLIVDDREISIGHAEQTITVGITANCPWKIGTMSQFITEPSQTSGTGSATIQFTVSKNNGIYGRVGVIEFLWGDGYMQKSVASVDQGVASIDISVESYEFGKNGGSMTQTVTADDAWVVVSKPLWVTCQESGQAGTNNITITASKNAIAQGRTGSVIFGLQGTQIQKGMVVSQEAADEALTVSQETFSPEYMQQTIPFTITANTTWEIVDISSPSLVFGQVSGSFDANNEFTIDENTGTTTRVFTATIRTKSGKISKTLTIYQGVNYADIQVSVTELNFDINNQERLFTIQSTKPWTLRTSDDVNYNFTPTSGNAGQLYIIRATAVRIYAQKDVFATATVYSGINREMISLFTKRELEPTDEE